MKVIIEDFNYNGHHIDQYVCELPQHLDISDEFKERIADYISEGLEAFIEEIEES